MTKVIIYPQANGSVAVIYPTGELPLEEVAQKDVPKGLPYKIMDKTDLPKDHEFFNAWESSFENHDGTGIGPQTWFINQYNAEIAAINAEQPPTQYAVVDFDQAVFPEEFDEAQRVAAYDQLVSDVAAQNAQFLADWQASKAARIAELEKMIATQQAEMAA